MSRPFSYTTATMDPASKPSDFFPNKHRASTDVSGSKSALSVEDVSNAAEDEVSLTNFSTRPPLVEKKKCVICCACCKKKKRERETSLDYSRSSLIETAHKKHDWTHPKHCWWVIIGSIVAFLSQGLILMSLVVVPWFYDRAGNYVGHGTLTALTNKEVVCDGYKCFLNPGDLITS